MNCCHLNDRGALRRARQIAEEALGGQRDFLLACHDLAAMRSKISCLPDSVLDVFVAVSSEVDDLSIGSEWQFLSSEVRKGVEANIREYRERVRFIVIDALGKLLILI